MSAQFDVAVIGAGPSGSVASSLLNKQGFKVCVLEKQHFPRFVIGESLLPHCMEMLEEAGFADAVRADYPQPLLHTSPITAPHERISMTLAAIEATPHVYLAIAGAEKRAVYQQAAQGAQQQHPVSFVLNSQKVTPHVFYHA